MQEQNTLSVSQYNAHIRVLRKACIVIAKKREEKSKISTLLSHCKPPLCTFHAP